LAEAIDPKRLPSTVMFDTSVLIPASLRRTGPSQEGACAPLLDALASEGRAVLVAAPSLAEFLRRAPKTPIPHIGTIEIVAFDRISADLLAQKFPKHALTTFRSNAKGDPPMHYIKYDAMIVACALRYKVDAFVSIDDSQRTMASAVGLKVAWPRDYMSPQQILVG
jgi:predicted nucleic acid-binding protein